MTLHDYLLQTYPALGWYQRDQAFADRVGTFRQNISRYRTFQRFPSPEMISRIRDETNGVVAADDHLPLAFQETTMQRATRLKALFESVFVEMTTASSKEAA
jgi:transcriptional regulator with XRE-family HTH domain